MKKIFFVLTLFVIGLTSCSDNAYVRQFGGTAEFKLPPNEKLVNVSWKGDELWYLTRPMTSTDTAQTYTYNEKSPIGMMEGTYVIIETKTSTDVPMSWETIK